jgi:hypothetical protein
MIDQRTLAKLMPPTGMGRCYHPNRPKFFPDGAELEGEESQGV